MSQPSSSDYPTFGLLTYPDLTIQEIADFYSIEHCSLPTTPIPYIWSNSIVSLDGYLSFLEPNDTGVEGISMRNHFPHLSKVDFKMLHAGWAHADVILITASCLRNEPKARICVLFDDLLEYREKVLKKRTRQPDVIILSRTGNMSLDHPAFHVKDQTVWIVTSPQGGSVLTSQTTAAPNPTTDSFVLTSPKCTKPIHLKILDDSTTTTNNASTKDVPLPDLLSFSYKTLGHRFMDCATGGDVIQQLVYYQSLKEMRMTYASQLSGSMSSLHQVRPHFFPFQLPFFNQQSSPLLEMQSIRACGKRLLFLRMTVEYRHEVMESFESLQKRKQREMEDEEEGKKKSS